MKLKSWKEDMRVANADAELDSARRAEADALDARDKARAVALATRSDLEQVTDERAAKRLEALLVKAETDVDARRLDYEAAERAVRRAEARYTPLRTAARRDAATLARTELDARIDGVAAAAAEFRASVEALRECGEFVEAEFEGDTSVGMVAADVREFFNVPHPVLGLYPRLMKTICGQNYRNLDAWLAMAREWRSR